MPTITQIVISAIDGFPDQIYGLGSDQKIYIWRANRTKWILHNDLNEND